ncbi:MAG: (Fe-S)-binding protein [Peptococcaceae bacterium]|nr:(Fe-S)-binding protein [Peptococcaceae bacterium]
MEIQIISVWEIYDRLGLPDTTLINAGRVAVHDACATRQEKEIHESVRRIAGRLGYQVEELDLSREKTACCGFGGLVKFANPGLAAQAVSRRAGESATDYVAYCAMCRDSLASGGKRCLHVLDMIYGGGREELAVRRAPGYSQRRENRARLKKTLLREVWGEEMEEEKGFEAINLEISDRVLELMESRMILVEDVKRVIDHAEKTGRKLLNRQSGHILAYCRPVSVTYWVEYTREGEAFIVHNAYSHRMQIVEGVKT